MSADLIRRIRNEAGLSQKDFAARAGTSPTTVSAYEHGHKSPTLTTFERLLDGAGFELNAEHVVDFTEVEMPRGRPIFVADRLWRLPIEQALATTSLTLGLDWSSPGSRFALADRRQRARCYEIVLREGMPTDMLRLIDGLLLVDAWAELVIPREIREAWQPLIDEVSS